MTLANPPAVTSQGPLIVEREGVSKLEQVIIQGNLAELTPAQRVTYYTSLCEAVGLNPLTKPFEYLTLNGKLILYAGKSCTEQVRLIRGISVDRLDRETQGDLAIVTAYGRDRSGRADSAMGAVAVKGLQGEALANAWMKAETKAKRRLTLSLGGLGMLDEVELDAVPGAWRTEVDVETGVIVDGAAQAEPQKLSDRLASKAASITDAAASSPQPAEEVPTAGGTASSAAPTEPDLLPASSEVEPVVPSGAAPSEAKCDAFHPQLGRCVKGAHEVPPLHRNKEGETWR